MIQQRKIIAEFDIQFEDSAIPPTTVAQLLGDYISLCRFVMTVHKMDVYPINKRFHILEISPLPDPDTVQ